MPTKIPTHQVLLYKHQPLKNGTYPVVLQVIYNRKTFRVSLKLYATESQWNQDGECFKKNYPNYKDYNEILRGVKMKVYAIMDTYRKQDKPFTKRGFLLAFFGNTSSKTFFEFVDLLDVELKNRNKFSTAANFKATSNNIRKFLGQVKSLQFTDIDYDFLKRFEVHLLKSGIKPSGTRDYLRHTRTIYNKAISRGLVDDKYYPFATRRNARGYSFSHLKVNSNPRALSLEDMQKVKDFPADQHPRLKKHWLFLLFSYYTRGMNFKDMALLYKDSIYDGRINYNRAKTNTAYNIKITEPIQEIIDYFDQPGKYVFPILPYNSKGKSREYKISTERKKFNRDLKEIASILGISINLTSYVARHTYANVLKKKNVSIGLISQAMGHKDTKTTEKFYLEMFADEIIDNLDELL